MVLSESVIILSDKLPDYHPLWNLAAEILGIEDDQAQNDRHLVEFISCDHPLTNSSYDKAIAKVKLWMCLEELAEESSIRWMRSFVNRLDETKKKIEGLGVQNG